MAPRPDWLIALCVLLGVTATLSLAGLNMLVPHSQRRDASEQLVETLRQRLEATEQAGEVQAAAVTAAQAAVAAADAAAAALREQLAAARQQAGHGASPEAAAAASGLSRGSPQLGATSARWAPLVLPACTAGMPPHFAPCLVGKPQNPGLAYGEEVIYPAFSIKEPGFVTEGHAATWRNAARMFAPNRYHLVNGRAYYPAQHAQNLVLRNVTFLNDPPTDRWGDRSCMGGRVSHRALAPLAPGQPLNWTGRAVLANPPDGWSLQHFADHVTKLLVHSEAWRQQGTRVVTGDEGMPLVADSWDILASSQGQQVLHTPGNFTAEELVFSCRCPITHPYFHERLRELMHLPEPTPLQDRKVVLYLSRNGKEEGMENGGRKVTNEAAVLQAIQAVLEERKQGERLVIFDKYRYRRVADLAGFMAGNVSAILGPHGGAWFNNWWAAPGTFLLEFMPMQRFATVLWEELSVAGLRYWVLPVESSPPQHDMEVDPSLVARALREQLGGPSPPEVHPYYAWDLAELM